MFGLHGFALSNVCLAQALTYDRGEQKLCKVWINVFMAIMWCLVLGLFVFELFNPDIDQSYGTVRMAGYGKAAITLVKYMPQVYLNYKRQSTVGFSAVQIMLDFAGGSFSFL